jgi:uncharacterized protein YjbJ (UPF0337 family)
LTRACEVVPHAGTLLGSRTFSGLELFIKLDRKKEIGMNWDRIEGNWKQFKGKMQQQWGKLTDDDLDLVNGRRQELAGKLQERYGLAKDAAERQIDDWAKTLQ